MRYRERDVDALLVADNSMIGNKQQRCDVCVWLGISYHTWGDLETGIRHDGRFFSYRAILE